MLSYAIKSTALLRSAVGGFSKPPTVRAAEKPCVRAEVIDEQHTFGDASTTTSAGAPRAAGADRELPAPIQAAPSLQVSSHSDYNPWLGVVDDQMLDVRHLMHGEGDAFAPDA